MLKIKKKGISDFIPQEWPDTTLPLDANGNRITLFDTDDSYWHWLADYLYETDIPLPESQRLYLEKGCISNCRKNALTLPKN
jgi:hypothetical protein